MPLLTDKHATNTVHVCVAGVRVLFQVAVVLVRRCLGEARQRKECEGQMETLERLRSVKGLVQHEQADVFIQEVCNLDGTSAQTKLSPLGSCPLVSVLNEVPLYYR